MELQYPQPKQYKCSMYRLDRSSVINSHNLSCMDSAMRGIEHASDVSIAIVAVVHIGKGQNSSREYQIYCCYFPQPAEKTGVSKGFCASLKPITNGFPCFQMVRVSTVFAEELSRISDFCTILGPRFPLEQFSRSYSKLKSTNWALKNISSLQSVVGWRGEQRNSVTSQVTSISQGAQSSSPVQPNNHKLDGNHRNELSFFLSFADCRALCLQIHCLKWTQGPLALEGLTRLIQSGVNVLTCGICLNPAQNGTTSSTTPVERLGGN